MSNITEYDSAVKTTIANLSSLKYVYWYVKLLIISTGA
jgi:hypothetical protein